MLLGNVLVDLGREQSSNLVKCFMYKYCKLQWLTSPQLLYFACVLFKCIIHSKALKIANSSFRLKSSVILMNTVFQD